MGLHRIYLYLFSFNVVSIINKCYVQVCVLCLLPIYDDVFLNSLKFGILHRVTLTVSIQAAHQ